jgi:hypothetical protein
MTSILTFKNGYEHTFDAVMGMATASAICWLSQKGTPKDKASNNHVPRDVALIVGIETVFRSALLMIVGAMSANAKEISPLRVFIGMPYAALTISLPLSMQIAEWFGLKAPNFISMMGYIHFSRYINFMTKGLIFVVFPSLLVNTKITLEKQ